MEKELSNLLYILRKNPEERESKEIKQIMHYFDKLALFDEFSHSERKSAKYLFS